MEAAEGAGRSRNEKRPRQEDCALSGEGGEGSAQPGQAQDKRPKVARSRPSEVGGEASVPTQRLYWLRATLDQSQALTQEQTEALALLKSEDVFAAALMSLIDCGESYPNAPQAFVQTDPDDGDQETDRAASLRVALAQPEHVAQMRTHTNGELMVAPGALADQPTAYVRYTLKHTSAAPVMARALREQAGVWLEVFTRGAPLAYNKEHVKRAVSELRPVLSLQGL